jgi:ABC-type dipeptide/oligopeptide/nickel transport system ATPase subunit
MNNLIKILNLSKSFNSSKKIKVLKKISYKFKKGKIYSLMGPSGSDQIQVQSLLKINKLILMTQMKMIF